MPTTITVSSLVFSPLDINHTVVGVPDYPPPSFQEAMTTPPLSVCSSTTSLVPTTILPLAIPEDIPEHPEASVENMAPLTEATESENIDNASDSDESLFIIEMNSVPVCSADLPKGAALEERVRKDWRRRRGVEFPGRTTALEASQKESDNNGKKTATRGRTMTKPKLEIDPVLSPTQDHGRLSPISSPKRRLMSLSPLRTLFPPKSPVHHDRAMSAHPSPSPSPYAASRSTFFRSSSSLAAASFLGLPLLSSVSVAPSKSEPLSRKIFSNKGKERAKGIEHLDVWEVLSEDTYAGVDKNGDEHPHSLMSAVESLQSMSNLGASPTRSQSFTFGTHAANTMRAKQSHIDSPEATRDEYSSETPHVRAVASLRDWKGPSKVLLDRPISRRVPTALSTLSDTSITSSITSLLETPTTEIAPPLPGPPLTSVRIRATSPSPPPSLTLKHTAHVAQSSPLRVDAIAKLNITTDKSAAAVAMHQKALETPLPSTPIYHTRFDPRGSINSSPPRVPSPARPVPDLLTDSISEPLTPQTALVPHLTIAVQPPTILSAKSSSLEPMTPTRHHYSGRPLPRPPPSAPHRAGVVDSTYASSETPRHDAEKNDQSFNSCPEGLLIDLEDTTLDNFSVSGTSTPRLDECRFAPPPHQSTMSRASSSVELLGDPSLSFDSIQAASTPLLPPSPGPSRTPQSAGVSDLTDLDLLVSRLTDGEQDGSDYDVSYGHNGWRQLVTHLNKQPDSALGSGGTWAREPYLTPRPSLSKGIYPEVIQPQRQYVAHRAY